MQKGRCGFVQCRLAGIRACSGRNDEYRIDLRLAICGGICSLVDSVEHDPTCFISNFVGSGHLPTRSLVLRATRLWVQSRYDEFEKGQPESAAISSLGYLEAGPALRSVLLTPSTYIWAVSSDKEGNAYLATGSPATVLKVTAAGVSTRLFSTKDLTVQAIRVGPDGSVYAATVPSGKVYRIKPGQSGLDEIERHSCLRRGNRRPHCGSE